MSKPLYELDYKAFRELVRHLNLSPDTQVIRFEHAAYKIKDYYSCAEIYDKNDPWKAINDLFNAFQQIKDLMVLTPSTLNDIELRKAALDKVHSDIFDAQEIVKKAEIVFQWLKRGNLNEESKG